MKRIFLAVSAVVFSLLLSTPAPAQILSETRFGVTGGFTSSSVNVAAITSKSISQYHVGLVTEIPLGAGFAFQPGLLYQVKGMSLADSKSAGWSDAFKALQTKVGYIEVPLQFQWGPDLVAFRPYVLAEPFVGYRLSIRQNDGATAAIQEEIKKGMKKIEYGLAVGAGIEVWAIQVSLKYFWNFGPLYQTGDTAVSSIKSAITDGNNFNGIALSAAILF